VKFIRVEISRGPLRSFRQVRLFDRRKDALRSCRLAVIKFAYTKTKDTFFH